MAGMRARLIHFYMGVDYKLLWETIKMKLPVVKSRIDYIIKSNTKGGNKQ